MNLEQIDKQIILGVIMLACLYYTLNFVLYANDRVKMEKEIRLEYDAVLNKTIANLPHVIYGCTYSQGTYTLNLTGPV